MYTIILLIGVILWIATHWIKRLAPDFRENLNQKYGAGKARGIITALIVISLVMMIIGYRGSSTNVLYSLPALFGPLCGLLMIIATVLLGMGKSKGRMRSWLRHPMLMGVLLWAVSHLLVNGDVASVILFGGMLIWSVASMQIINKTEGAWVRPEPGPASGDIRLLIISAVLFVVIVVIHTLLGYPPMGAH